ncbi:YopX family protein [Bacillus velezensis]|uniref:YopX family protein n=1 Tax=Bacillus velezensis TaxID=492670 RepID=UPI002DB94419|nr:YopX family protein [Bacillus velezensis]MEC3772215.1 YopX family protein [Bacillus velezensis]
MNTAYRVWDGEKMHYWDDEGLSLELKGDNWILWRDGCRVIVAESYDRNSVLMWGTGLKDKNEKMIYERDFFEFERGIKGVVKWIEGQAIFNVPEYYDSYSDCPWLAFGEYAHCFGEVKGNTLENPELLEGAE